MKALVTGGAGFIGSHIAHRLVDDGWSVTVLDDLSTGEFDAVPTGAELVVRDVSDPSVVGDIGEIDPDIVVHAAAQTSVSRSMRDPWLDWRTNVQGTWNVIQGSRVADSQRFVFLSSGGAIYGDSDGATEDALPAPQSYYAIHKYVSERYVEFSGLSCSIARLANVYGPGQRGDHEGGVVAVFSEALQNGGDVTIYGSGKQSRDFIHVDDVVTALVCMIDSDKNGLWNVGTGSATSIIDLLHRLQDVIARCLRVIRSEPPGRCQPLTADRGPGDV